MQEALDWFEINTGSAMILKSSQFGRHSTLTQKGAGRRYGRLPTYLRLQFAFYRSIATPNTPIMTIFSVLTHVQILFKHTMRVIYTIGILFVGVIATSTAAPMGTTDTVELNKRLPKLGMWASPKEEARFAGNSVAASSSPGERYPKFGMWASLQEESKFADSKAVVGNQP
ncbi:hypothetical protein PAAG_12586 [Paracoccidioides lutzii Pb01]|uniref:Uncharacterized protein n=1 Tax=Paracoccidioides lutzii (strain ATCC MYA-826 / Pb01) TaxID=502779 RepID=A0A0A2UZT5_PARBA|nr:hypothetical protein PAAG_12586 [Paracoccidioides lutzii Pb01]KGQ00743.1 hypothetical protein PAAG_12586 [Paracoccidioides lutzii Pb01]